MKVNKKVVLSTAAVLGVAGLVAGGTIAYFTDKTDLKTNTFTIGDVKIELYESQLHRQNSGRMGNFPALASDPDYCDWTVSSTVATTAGDSTLINGSYDKARYCTPNMDVEVGDSTNISAVAAGHTKASRNWGFSDDTIKTDAATYEANNGYFARNAQNVVPGQWIRKFAYVENADKENNAYNGSDAYVLIRYMVPTNIADKIDVKIPGTPYEEDTSSQDGLQPYFYAVEKNNNTYSAYELTEKTENNKTSLVVDDYEGYTEEINGTTYRVYAAVTTQPLTAGEMTFWSPVNTIRIKPNMQNTDSTITSTYVAPGALYDVKVDAQAIQAKTFSDAIDAINHL